jgi:nucleotide-binding universal stress UspA family protein
MATVQDSNSEIPSSRTSLPFKRILVAVDGSRDSEKASKSALDLAETYRADLIFLSIIPGKEYDRSKTDAKNKAEIIVEKQVSVAESRGVKARREIIPAMESIVGQIVDYADRGKIDLIVMGTRGLGGFQRMLIGSVSSGVVTHASCPVLVVR